jgi:PIN domain nuclease of toxin-antitoxin system
VLYIVDTHALVWFVAADARLSPSARTVLTDPGAGNRLAVPTIVLAEAWDLARKKRVSVPYVQVLRAVRASRALVWPLEDTIISRFPGQLTDIHDEIIVATALELQISYSYVSIITRDQQIAGLGVVPCIW